MAELQHWEQTKVLYLFTSLTAGMSIGSGLLKSAEEAYEAMRIESYHHRNFTHRDHSEECKNTIHVY
jgi:hypothetical protein